MKSLQEIFETEAAKPAIQIRKLKPLGTPLLYIPSKETEKMNEEISCEEYYSPENLEASAMGC